MMKSKSLLAIASLTIMMGTSCIKKDPLAEITQVLLVPLSPDALAVDFIINDQVQATTVNYSSTVGTATYNFPYYTVPPGTLKVSYLLSGTKSVYASGDVSTQNDNAYSTFLIDSTKRGKMAVVKDDLSRPTEGKVKIRFFHFSPNAPAIDVAKVGGATLFTNRSFNDQSNAAFQQFIEVDPGPYQFSFRTAGTATEVYKTTSLNLLPDRIYTLCARGVVGGAGNKALGALWYPNRP